VGALVSNRATSYNTRIHETFANVSVVLVSRSEAEGERLRRQEWLHGDLEGQARRKISANIGVRVARSAGLEPATF
jgi:hypothetical protein